MKKNIFLSLILLLSVSFAFAQNNETPTTPSQNIGESDPLLSHYGKQLNIAMHKKDSKPVVHKANDRFVFMKDGKYTQVWNGVECSGTWTYNTARKKLTLVCNNVTTIWVVVSFTADKLELTQTGQTLALIQKK